MSWLYSQALVGAKMKCESCGQEKPEPIKKDEALIMEKTK